MKNKFKFLATMLIGILLSTNVWGTTATITFKSNGTSSDASSTQSKEDFVKNCIDSKDAAFGTITCSAAERVYLGKSSNGLKLGASSNAGSFTISFTAIANVKKIILNRASYSDFKTATITVKNGSTTLANAVSTPSGTAAFSDMEIDLSSNVIASLSTLSVSTSKYCYIKSISVEYGSSVACTINFDGNGHGTPASSSLTEASVGAGITLPNCTPNAGYAFLGWSTNSAATQPDANMTAGKTYKPGSNGTLYAVYAQSYTVNWYVNGNPRAVAVPQGGDLVIPQDIVTDIDCGGKVFVGWTTNATYNNPTTAPSDLFTVASGKVNANANYYAVYANEAGEATTKTYGWETTDDDTDWTISNTITATDADESHSANSGSKYGLFNSNSTIQFKNKVNVTAFSYYCVRRTTNTNTSIIIQYSTDGTNWTNETSALGWNDFNSDGKTYKQHENTWDGTNQYYVRLNVVTAAYRQLDDISITYGAVTYSNYSTGCTKYSVTFKNQESVISTTEYTAGTVIHAPATAENTCGEGFFFVGWLAQPLYVGATPHPKPAGLIQPNGEITVPAENVTYYAVFAQKRIN